MNDNFLASSSPMDDVKPLSLEEMHRITRKFINDKEKSGPVYKYGLVSPMVFNQLEKLSHKEMSDYLGGINSNHVTGIGNFCGIAMRELEGLDGVMLFFKELEDLERFFKVVDDFKVINFLSQKSAVREAIQFFEFLGKMKDKSVNKV